jgi:hypothetical protein
LEVAIIPKKLLQEVSSSFSFRSAYWAYSYNQIQVFLRGFYVISTGDDSAIFYDLFCRLAPPHDTLPSQETQSEPI